MSGPLLIGDARRIHLVGVGGAGMSGVAVILAHLGHRVSGSDLKPGRLFDGLGDHGVETWIGHDPAAMRGVDLVVASSAVPESDPELRAALTAGATVWRRPELLEALTATMPAIGFTGTHGKTSSTALAVAALRAAGRDPSFLVGGELADLNTNAHVGERDLFVLEADEAFGTFRRLHLRGLLVTNVEPDHLDHYRTFGELEQAFIDVAAGTRGPVLACADDPGARRLAEQVGATTYGTSPDADWVIGDVVTGARRVAFTLTGGSVELQVEVSRPGLHVARNSAGVLALLAGLGVDPVAAARGLASFGGVRRRFELRAQIAGVTVVDDYAHHPTEVAATVAAARLGPWTRIWAVFQPHRYTRTAEMAVPLGGALVAADRVVVSDVYGAGEEPRPGVTGQLVADAAKAAGAARVDYVPARRDLATAIAAEVADGDLVLLLGAGDITGVADELVTLLGSRV